MHTWLARLLARPAIDPAPGFVTLYMNVRHVTIGYRVPDRERAIARHILKKRRKHPGAQFAVRHRRDPT